MKNIPPEYPHEDENGTKGMIFAIAVSIGFYAVLAVLILFLAGCAEYPVAFEVDSKYGRASYSAKGGLKLTMEK